METGFSLGSNLGDRLDALRRARDGLLEVSGARLAAQSAVYETEPVGVLPAYRDLVFLNAVVVVESDLAPGEWLHRAQRVEREMGRVRTGDRFAPRPIDIDILFSGDVYIEQGILVVPHPRWAERRFVVQPLADVRPDLVLPDVARTVREILADLPPSPSARAIVEAKDW